MYCTGRGSFSPIRSSILAISSAVAWGPRMDTAGLPGMTRVMTKVILIVISSTGINCSTRLTIIFIMQ